MIPGLAAQPGLMGGDSGAIVTYTDRQSSSVSGSTHT